MATGTKIQWADDTVNPTMGCDGCELWSDRTGVHRCYAGLLHRRHGGSNPGYAPAFEQVTLFPGRMEKAARQGELTGRQRRGKPWLDGCPRLLFVSDMSDALSKAVSFAYLEAEVIEHVASPAGQRHAWLWLTKQPRRMAQFSRWLAQRGTAWPANLWPATSITTKATVSRIAQLLEVGDAHTRRFLSVEPQWEELRLRRQLGEVDWVIQGGESGSGAKPFDLAWARRLRDDCADKGVPYFLKQVGRRPVEQGQPVKLADGHGGDWSEWPADLRVRQMPEFRAD